MSLTKILALTYGLTFLGCANNATLNNSLNATPLPNPIENRYTSQQANEERQIEVISSIRQFDNTWSNIYGPIDDKRSLAHVLSPLAPALLYDANQDGEFDCKANIRMADTNFDGLIDAIRSETSCNSGRYNVLTDDDDFDGMPNTYNTDFENEVGELEPDGIYDVQRDFFPPEPEDVVRSMGDIFELLKP